MRQQSKIDWDPPAPRTAWDQFVGPGATRAEVILQLGGAVVGGILCLIAYLTAVQQENNQGQQGETGSSSNQVLSLLFWQQPQNWLTGQTALVLLLAIDMVGGVITNATSAAKRWYHRSGQTAWHHLAFVSIHAFQIGLVAWQMSPKPQVFFASVYLYILAASAIIVAVPLYLQRAVAMMFAALATPLTLLFLKDDVVPTGMEWFIPILTIKLLVSHLIQEAPFQPNTPQNVAMSGKKIP